VLAELLHGVPSAPSARHPHLVAGFDAWFLQACHREPECRFASAVQQIETLASALGLPCAPNAGERTLPSTPAADVASGFGAADASAPASHRPAAKKRLVRVVGAALALCAAILAYRAFSAREATPRGVQEAGLPASPQVDIGHDPVIPAERTPRPASTSVAPLADPGGRSQNCAARRRHRRRCASASTSKPARAPEPVSAPKAEPVAAPDPTGIRNSRERRGSGPR
jgi:hypothetical protein